MEIKKQRIVFLMEITDFFHGCDVVYASKLQHMKKEKTMSVEKSDRIDSVSKKKRRTLTLFNSKGFLSVAKKDDGHAQYEEKAPEKKTAGRA